MGKRFPRFTRGLIGAVLAALGVFLLVFQQEATDIVARVSGAGFAVAGAVSIIGSLTGSKGADRFGSSFSGGVVLLALGLLLVAWPESFISYLYILISVAIIFYGVEGISRAVASHTAGSTRWGAALLAAIVIVLLGVCTLATPLAEATTALRVEGVILIIVGVLGMADAFYFSGTGKKKAKKDGAGEKAATQGAAGTAAGAADEKAAAGTQAAGAGAAAGAAGATAGAAGSQASAAAAAGSAVAAGTGATPAAGTQAGGADAAAASSAQGQTQTTGVGPTGGAK